MCKKCDQNSTNKATDKRSMKIRTAVKPKNDCRPVKSHAHPDIGRLKETNGITIDPVTGQLCSCGTTTHRCSKCKLLVCQFCSKGENESERECVDVLRCNTDLNNEIEKEK